MNISDNWRAIQKAVMAGGGGCSAEAEAFSAPAFSSGRILRTSGQNARWVGFGEKHYVGRWKCMYCSGLRSVDSDHCEGCGAPRFLSDTTKGTT